MNIRLCALALYLCALVPLASCQPRPKAEQAHPDNEVPSHVRAADVHATKSGGAEGSSERIAKGDVFHVNLGIGKLACWTADGKKVTIVFPNGCTVTTTTPNGH